jgi:hypothetical protein
VGRLGAWEETLFFQQLKRAGFRLGFARDAIVIHHFDEARLSREAFIQRAIDEGRSRAYVSWHWKHEKPRLLRIRLGILQRELESSRRCRSPATETNEGLPLWEFELVQKISFLEHMREVCREPHAYPRFGLRRIE